MPVYPMQMDLTTGRALVGPLGSGMIGSGSLTSGVEIPAPVVVSGPIVVLPTAAPGAKAVLQVWSGVGFQRTATTPRQGLLTYVNMLVSGEVAAISGPGGGMELYTDLFALVFPPPAAPGSAFNFAVTQYQLGSGGARATSGYWALSSWVGSGQIGRNHIAALAIGSGSLGNGAVLSANIASGQIGEEHIASGVIVAADLASGAVLSGNIGNAAVVSGSIASGQIGTNHVAENAVLPNILFSGRVEVITSNFQFFHGARTLSGFPGVARLEQVQAPFTTHGGQGGYEQFGYRPLGTPVLSNKGGLASGDAVVGYTAFAFEGSANAYAWVFNQAVLIQNTPVSGRHGALYQLRLADPNEAVDQITTVPTTKFQVGSGGSYFTSGYWLLSGGVGSGQIGGNHIAAGGVVSANIASGAIGTEHFNPQSGIFGGGADPAAGNFARLKGTASGGLDFDLWNAALASGSWVNFRALGGATPTGLGGMRLVNRLSGIADTDLWLDTRDAGNTATRIKVQSGGIVAVSGFWALSSVIGSGQIGNNHLAAQAVQSNSIASGILGGTQWNPTTAIVGLIVSGVISAGGHIEAASGLWGGQQAPVANVVGELAQALSVGLTYFRATNLAIGSGVGAAFGVYVGSGTGTNKRPVAVFAGLNAVSAGPADPVGIGQIILFDPNVGQVVAHQFGSGGATAGSGYGALSSFIGSGQIGGTHLAAAAVLSANIGSGQVGGNHLGTLAGLKTSGAIAFLTLYTNGNSDFIEVFSGIGRIGVAQNSGRGYYAIQTNVASGGTHITSGPAWAIDIDAWRERIAIGRSLQNDGVGANFSVLYNFGSGGATATSGFWALSSFFGSGQIGNNHLAAGAVLSANIASGHVGNNHLRLMSGLVISGSLGIGVAPAQILHVAQSNATNVILRIDNMVDTSGTGIQIQMIDGANTFELGGLEVINLSGGGVSELHLRTRVQGSTVRRMSILSGGNIIATSGFGAISSFIRSGTVGGFHLAMPTVSGVYAWGTVAFFNPASGWLSVAPGLSGQRLTTNGSGFDPAWAA